MNPYSNTYQRLRAEREAEAGYTALPPTLQTRMGQGLQGYLGGLRSMQPTDNPYGKAAFDFFLSGAEDMAGEMARGNPYAVIDPRPRGPYINPQILDTLGILPVATAAKIPSEVIAPGLLAGAAAAMGKIAKPTADASSDIESLLGYSLLNRPDFQSAIFAGDIGADRLEDAGNELPKLALRLARQIADRGGSAVEIHNATARLGYPVHRGADGNFRFEIDDSGMQYRGERVPAKLGPYGSGEEYQIYNEQLQNIIEHPELEKAYPNILSRRAEITTYPSRENDWLDYNRSGTFNPYLDESSSQPVFTIKGAVETQPSTAIHEIQHAIQKQEDFASGGNPETAIRHTTDALYGERAKAARQVTESTKGLTPDQVLDEIAHVGQAHNRMLDMDAIIGYENISQPRFLFNTGEYYKYSDEISRKLGKMPSRNPKKKEWIQKAGQMIAERKKIETGITDADLSQYRRDRNSLKNALRRSDRRLRKLRDTPGLREFERAERRIDNFNPSDQSAEAKFRAYQNLAGETEARTAEARLRMPLEERLRTPAERSMDVPIDEQVAISHKKPAGLLEMTGYHGTPHRFPPTETNPLGEFDLQKIGTGEGNQAYGYGIYVAEHPDTAKTYARSSEGAYKRLSGHLEPKVERAYDYMDRGMSTMDTVGEMGKVYPDASFEEISDAIDEARALVPRDKSLYEVDIPDEIIDNQMLDYDAPLSEQPEVIKQHLTELADFRIEQTASGKGWQIPHKGGWIAERFPGTYKSKEAAEKALNKYIQSELRVQDIIPQNAEESARLVELGISGIKYKDAISRGKEGGTRNFVLFDPSIATITGRN